MDKQETLDKRELVIREMLVEEAVAVVAAAATRPGSRWAGTQDNLLLLVAPAAVVADLHHRQAILVLREQQEMLELQMREQQEIPDRLDKHLLHSELHFLEVLEVLEVHVIPDKLEQEVLVEMVDLVDKGYRGSAASPATAAVEGILEDNQGPLVLQLLVVAVALEDPQVAAAVAAVVTPCSTAALVVAAEAVEDPKQGILEILEMQIMANLGH
jgi:hypothetical protein